MSGEFRTRVLLVPVIALISLPVPAQDLTLFQDAGGGGFRGGPPQEGPQAAVPASAAPALALKGIYRFGDTYHVSLQSDQGAIYKATWQAGQQNSVPVASGYEIQVVNSRQVTLGMPLGTSCQQNPQSGGTCLDRNQVALSFAESAPVPARRGQQNTRNGNTVSFSFDNGNNGNRAATDVRQLLEAAQSGNAEAEAALRTLIGNRGQGRGGRGGGNNNAANNNGGNNNGGNNNGGGANGGRGGRGNAQ
jgi:hypothetical protein